MKKQVLSAVLGLALTVTAAGAAVAAQGEENIDASGYVMLEQGASIGAEIQDTVRAIPNGEAAVELAEGTETGSNADLIAILGENDQLEGSAVQDKVVPEDYTGNQTSGGLRPVPDTVSTEQSSGAAGYFHLTDTDELGTPVQDSVIETD